MAADTRKFKSKEKDKNGNEVIFRDQYQIEATSDTTMASSSCFQTTDVDGKIVKIPRDNMMSLVKECIGELLSDSSAEIGTDLTKIVTLKNSALGATTKSNLINTLKSLIFEYKGDYDGDMDDLKSWCWGYTAAGATNLPPGWSSATFLVFPIRNGQYPMQIAVSEQGFAARRYLFNTWMAWKT